MSLHVGWLRDRGMSPSRWCFDSAPEALVHVFIQFGTGNKAPSHSPRFEQRGRDTHANIARRPNARPSTGAKHAAQALVTTFFGPTATATTARCIRFIKLLPNIKCLSVMGRLWSTRFSLHWYATCRGVNRLFGTSWTSLWCL